VERQQQSPFDNKLARSIDWLRQRRPALASLAVLPVVATLAIAVAQLPAKPSYTLPCPIYPNGMVTMTATLHEACPLSYTDQLDGVLTEGRIRSLRGADEIRAEITSATPVIFRVQPLRGPAHAVSLSPVLVQPAEASVRLAAASLIAVLMIAAVLMTSVRAQVPASLPFSLIHAVAGVGIVTTVVGWSSSAFEIPAALARATMAGAVAHLGLVFPQRRGLIEHFPEAIAAPYVFPLIVSIVEIDAAYRGSAISTALAQRLLLVLAGVGVCILVTSCFYTIRGSASHLARGQARVFLSAAAILSVPALATAVFGTPDVRLAAVTAMAALLPFPVGYAISRYQVADLDESFRVLLAHGLYLSLWSLFFFLLIFAVHDRLDVPPVLKHPTVTFACVYSVLAPLDYLRSRLKAELQALVVTRRADWDRLGRDFARRIAGERTPRGIARAICDAIRAGLSEPGVVVLVAEGTVLQVAHAVGARALLDTSLAAELAAWSADPVVDLNRAVELSGPAKEAHDAGVGAFARIENSDGLLGCVIVFPERCPRLLGASERMWIATVSGHAASALAATKLEEELRVAERSAARGRIEAELAHEIGKPLGVLELTAEKLVAAMPPDDPAAAQLGRIHRLATHVREMTRAVLQAEKKSAQAKLEDIVETACEEVRAVHGDVQLVVDPLPAVGALPSGYERLVRVLVNLIDNAVHASGADRGAELRAQISDGALELIVDDSGHGMTPEQLRRALEPFATFRPGGTGLGLAICDQITRSLGGTLALSPRPEGRGLRALVRLPGFR